MADGETVEVNAPAAGVAVVVSAGVLITTAEAEPKLLAVVSVLAVVVRWYRGRGGSTFSSLSLGGEWVSGGFSAVWL